MSKRNERPNYYAIIPASVRYDKDLTPNAKLLYGEITALCNEKGFCWASNQYFADLYSVSKKSISTWINQLVEKRYIQSRTIYKEGTKEIENRYLTILNDPIEENFHTPMEDNFHTPKSSETLGGVEERSFTPMEDNFHTPIEENFHTPMEENVKDNNTVFNITSFNNTNNNTKSKNKPTPKQIRAEFDCLWALYPNKKGKENATRTYQRLRENKKVTFETVKKGIEMYVKYIKFHGLDKTKIKHGSTWFNQQGWQDEYEEADFQNKQQYSKFTQIMLSEMENPDQFLVDIGVEEYEPRRDRKIISHD